MFELFCRRVDISVAGGDETRTSALEKHEERAIFLEESKNSIEEAFDWKVISKSLQITDLLVERLTTLKFPFNILSEKP